MESNKTKNISEKRNARRGFIKKSSIIAGISVLPASNVWGVCSVSGTSGGSKQSNDTCVVPSFFGGFNDAMWILFTSLDAAANRDQMKFISTIGENETFTTGTQQNKREFYYEKISSFLRTTHLNFQGVAGIPSLNKSVSNMLASSSLNEKRTAAVFVNVSLGYATVPAQFSGMNGLLEFVEHVWGSLHLNGMNTVNVVNSSFTQIPISEAILSNNLPI